MEEQPVPLTPPPWIIKWVTRIMLGAGGIAMIVTFLAMPRFIVFDQELPWQELWGTKTAYAWLGMGFVTFYAGFGVRNRVRPRSPSSTTARV